MKRWLRAVGVACFLVATVATGPARSANPLPIAPVAQQSAVWCWLASLEMVFRYYHIPAVNTVSYQCGMAAAWFGGPCLSACNWCQVGSGPVDTLVAMIKRYPGFARQLTHRPGPMLTAEATYGELSEDDLKSEIDEGRPVIAGISPHSGLLPPGLSEHAVVIVGYQQRGDQLFVLLNDPFPYAAVGMQNPYSGVGGTQLFPGRFRIPYQVMVDDLAWGNTVSGIQRDD